MLTDFLDLIPIHTHKPVDHHSPLLVLTDCRPRRLGGARAAIEEENAGRYSREEIERQNKLLAEKIASGSYSVKRRP